MAAYGNDGRQSGATAMLFIVKMVILKKKHPGSVKEKMMAAYRAWRLDGGALRPACEKPYNGCWRISNPENSVAWRRSRKLFKR